MSSGIPYLGSKISLISKSEIRYEGILYTIDTKESTVALAKVRSFGTEDRPTDRPVAPRDEVYEYIIFRANDIKDLRVSEPPKPQSTLPGGLTNDPAIVQHFLQHSAPVAPGVAPGTYPPSFNQTPSYGPIGALPTYPQYPNQPHLPQPFMGSQQTGSRSGTPTPTPQQRKSPTMDAGVQVSGGPSARDDKDKVPPSQPQTRPIKSGPPTQPLPQRRPPASVQRPPQQLQQQHMQQQKPQPQQHIQQAQQRGMPRRFRNRVRQNFSNKQKEVLKFDAEYDFEQANAEFQELESKLSKTKIVDEKKDDSGTETQVGGDSHEEDDVSFYDKSKSFFDNISCESLERSKGSFQRLDWRQERKLNAETFGISASNNWMRRNAWRGRGGFFGRGRGNRGGPRGRGGPRNYYCFPVATSQNSTPQRKPTNPV